MKNKITAFVLAACLLLSLTACGKPAETPKEIEPAPVEATETPQNTPAAESEPAEEPLPEENIEKTIELTDLNTTRAMFITSWEEDGVYWYAFAVQNPISMLRITSTIDGETLTGKVVKGQVCLSTEHNASSACRDYIEQEVLLLKSDVEIDPAEVVFSHDSYGTSIPAQEFKADSSFKVTSDVDVRRGCLAKIGDKYFVYNAGASSVWYNGYTNGSGSSTFLLPLCPLNDGIDVLRANENDMALVMGRYGASNDYKGVYSFGDSVDLPSGYKYVFEYEIDEGLIKVKHGIAPDVPGNDLPEDLDDLSVWLCLKYKDAIIDA